MTKKELNEVKIKQMNFSTRFNVLGEKERERANVFFFLFSLKVNPLLPPFPYQLVNNSFSKHNIICVQ